MKLILRRRIVESLASLSGEGKEGVGFVLGRGNVGEVFVPVRNAADEPHKFYVEPAEIYKVVKYCEEQGYDIVALAHTHYGESRPSVHDVEGMRLWRVPWLIYSTDFSTTRCWILQEGKVVEVEYELT